MFLSTINAALAISEDYSNKVRLERQKLLHFGRDRGGDFKLHFNKLNIANQTFLCMIPLQML